MENEKRNNGKWGGGEVWILRPSGGGWCSVVVWAWLHLQVHEKLLACSNTEGAAEEETLVENRQLVSEEECWSCCGLRNEVLLSFAATRRSHADAS